jgi:hypothetical protein
MERIQLPVLKSDTGSLFFAGKPVEAAKACMVANDGEPCEAFGIESAANARYVGPASVQLELLKDSPAPAPNRGKGDEGKILEELRERGQRGIDGSCRFIGRVAYCWRREENQPGQQG